MNQNVKLENRGKRSKPGLGQQVQIICADPDAEGMGYPDYDVCWQTTGEDFAVSHWPMVVKCDLGLSDQDVVRMLLWLAARLDKRK